MRKTFVRALTVGGLSAGLAVPAAFGGTAFADPSGDSFALTCGSTTYQVTTMGNGDFTPAHDLNSNLMFVPHAFSGFHADIYDASGNLVETWDDEGISQGSGKQKNDVSCTYSFNEVSDGSDPEFPEGYRFVGSGGVTGQIAGHA